MTAIQDTLAGITIGEPTSHRNLALFPILGLGLGLGAGAPAAERLPGPVLARVMTILDGDTLEVQARIWLGQAVTTRVRLDGIDAPELIGKCGAEGAKPRGRVQAHTGLPCPA